MIAGLRLLIYLICITQLNSDFQYGDWNPVFAYNSGSASPDVEIYTAKYMRINKIVYLQCYANINNAGSGNNFIIKGAPFNITVNRSTGVLINANYTLNIISSALNDFYITLNGQNCNSDNLRTGNLIFSIFYITDV